MKHTKKIESKYFRDIIAGVKTFEIRKEDDCRYEVGDVIELVEIEIVVKEYDRYREIVEHMIERTGRSKLVQITYKLSHEDFPEGIMPDYVVLGIKVRSGRE